VIKTCGDSLMAEQLSFQIEEAKERGWKPVKREGKHRYLYLLGNNKKDLLSKVLLPSLPYPKKVIND